MMRAGKEGRRDRLDMIMIIPIHRGEGTTTERTGIMMATDDASPVKVVRVCRSR
jgi:hypothetical protein